MAARHQAAGAHANSRSNGWRMSPFFADNPGRRARLPAAIRVLGCPASFHALNLSTTRPDPMKGEFGSLPVCVPREKRRIRYESEAPVVHQIFLTGPSAPLKDLRARNRSRFRCSIMPQVRPGKRHADPADRRGRTPARALSKIADRAKREHEEVFCRTGGDLHPGALWGGERRGLPATRSVFWARFAFGLAQVGAIYGIGPISGGHVNPAVSLGVWVAERMLSADMIGYWVGSASADISPHGCCW